MMADSEQMILDDGQQESLVLEGQVANKKGEDGIGLDDGAVTNTEGAAASLSDEEGAVSGSAKKRGEYGFYPPSLRVQIAKMALEEGVSKTADHFSDDLGRYVSPSTVASIRNQYMKEVSRCIEEDVFQISELPKAETGRPLLLEELDSHIVQCVQKIRDSGGAINAAVIKRIARDIIIANNKSLLLEYGGPFELSNAWAERTLTRIGGDVTKRTRSSSRKAKNSTRRSSSPGLEEMKKAYVDIIKSAVKTHGLPKELIPTADQLATKRRRSLREHVRVSTAAVEAARQANDLKEPVSAGDDTDKEETQSVGGDEPPSDAESSSAEEVEEKKKQPAKQYKLMACPVTRDKKILAKKRFRILRIPARNFPRTCIAQRNAKNPPQPPPTATDETVVDSTSVDIPEEELIEMAIPCMTGKRKRGDYATYTSEQRIQMAKMALEVGVAKTAQHFTAELGRYVSPSSVASMRNQYRRESEKSQNEVVELPKGKRGRPLLLGHLDSEIKHSIEAIKNNGGKVGRNVVKSVARDIILANNRGLLKEYGGPLQLTNTWAESVMKRMGFVRRRRNKASSGGKVSSSSKLQTPKNGKGVTNEFEELNQAYMDVINNAVNSAVTTHGLTNDLINNYDQYSSHQSVPPNHIPAHNFNPNQISHPNHILHHSVSHPHVASTTVVPYNVEMQMNRGGNPQVGMMQPQEQDAGVGLGHVRVQMDDFCTSAFNHSNSYYSGWAGPATREFTVMVGPYSQPGNASQPPPIGYNQQIEPQHMNQHQSSAPMDRHGMANVRSDTANLTTISSGGYPPQAQMVSSHSVSQPNLQRHAIHDVSPHSIVPVSQQHLSQQQQHHHSVPPQMPDSSSAPPNTSPSNVPMQSEISANTNNINPLVNPQKVNQEVPTSSTHSVQASPSQTPSDALPVISNNEKGTSIVTSRTEETDNVTSPISKTPASAGRKKKTPKPKKVSDSKRKRGEYGVYTPDQRMKMAKLALEYGVTKAANIVSEEMGRVVSSSTVASMRNLYLREIERTNEDIDELPKGKRGRPLLLGDLDSQIQRCLMNIRVNGGVITRMVVVSVARGIITAKNKSLLKEYGGPVELSTTWAESVIRRMGFVRQKTDGSETSIPPDFENLKSAFLKRITSAVISNSIPKELILNFGQTALKIVPSSSWTTDGHGSQHLSTQLPTLEIEDRREITSVLTVSLAGDMLPLQLIYTGKTDQCHPNTQFPDGWNITHTENHLCTNDTMIQFADKLLLPYVVRTRSLLGLSPNHKALVVFDVLNMNQDKDFFSRLRENDIEVVLVPTPCTAMLQPLELAVCGRFRDELYKLFVNWYSAEVCEAVRAGQNPSNVIVDLRLSVLKHLHAQWVLKTHQLIGQDRGLVLEGFGKAGVIEALSTASRNVKQNNS